MQWILCSMAQCFPIALKNFHHFRFLKCLPCPNHQFCFFYLIQPDNKNSEHTDK